jgi:hypothetical protein
MLLVLFITLHRDMPQLRPPELEDMLQLALFLQLNENQLISCQYLCRCPLNPIN